MPLSAEQRKVYNAAYYCANRPRLDAANNDWAKRNREKSRAIKRAWERRNPEKARACHNNYRRRMKLENPAFKASCTLRSRFVKVLRSRGLYKRRCNFRMSDATEIVSHLERNFKDGMTWANHGIAWHIDHIIPCAEFDLTDPRQVARCFHWSNLQPLWKNDNQRKGAKLMRQTEFNLT